MHNHTHKYKCLERMLSLCKYQNYRIVVKTFNPSPQETKASRSL